MASDDVVWTVTGLAEVTKQLLGLAPKLRVKYLRHALVAGAKLVQRIAIDEAPILAKPRYRKGVLIRKPGTLKAAIKIRSSRDATRNGDVGVFINVKPAKGANRGKWSPNDPFYWRWVHFGAKTVKFPKRFLNKGAAILEGECLSAIKADLAPAIQKLNNP